MVESNGINGTSHKTLNASAPAPADANGVMKFPVCTNNFGTNVLGCDEQVRRAPADRS
jgi:hypothetical protein